MKTISLIRSLLPGALLAIATLSGSLCASTIHLDSQVGLANTLSSGTVAITPHLLWQSNNPVNPGDPTDTSAIWISYAFTGVGDADFQPEMDQTPVVTITDSFTSGSGFLTLNVWADDTAGVFLDGISLIAPVFDQSICSGAPVGCRPQDAGVLSSALAAGPHTLSFTLYQVGTGTDNVSNPFGLLYTGTAPAVPEPATLFLAGGALLAIGLARRRHPKRS
jgi:hypothetical protein